MRSRFLLAPLLALLVTGCGSAGRSVSAGAETSATSSSEPAVTPTSTTLLEPPPAAEFVAGDGDTDCPPGTMVARARPAAARFPLGATVTIYVTLTATVDCTWHPMEFWRPFAAVSTPDGTLVGGERPSAPGAVARTVVHLRAGQEVLVHTSTWDQHTFGPPTGERSLAPAPLDGPLVPAGTYLATAEVDAATAGAAEPFEVVA